jgi:hypothetical protein
VKSIKTFSYSLRASVAAAFLALVMVGFWLKARKDAWRWDLDWVALWALWPAAVVGLLAFATTLPKRRGAAWLMRSAVLVWFVAGVVPAVMAWPFVIPWSLRADILVVAVLLFLAATAGCLHARGLAWPADKRDSRTLPWPGLDVNLRKMELIETVVPLRGNWTPITVGALTVTFGGVVKTLFGDHQAWVGIVLGVGLGIGVSIYMGRRFAKGWMLRKLEREFGNGRLFDLKETLG